MKHWHVIDHVQPDISTVVRVERTYPRAEKRALAYARTLGLGEPHVERSNPRLPYRQATIYLDQGAILINECERVHQRWGLSPTRLVHERKHDALGRIFFVARLPSGAAGSVGYDDQLGRVFTEDRHLPVRLAEGGYWEGQRPFDCPFTGEPSYCDGTSLSSLRYTTDAAMFEAAERWIPSPLWGRVHYGTGGVASC